MKSNRAMRRAVLRSLFQYLECNYNLAWSEEEVTQGQVSLHEVDAFLAFKSDSRLEDLRGALQRLEMDLYGTCALCKAPIAEEALEIDPAVRFCKNCEKAFSTVDTHSFHPAVAH